MGFFSRVKDHTRNLQRISNGVAYITEFLDRYEYDYEMAGLDWSAWVYKTAVSDTLRTRDILPQHTFFVSYRGQLIKMNSRDALNLTIGRIQKLIEHLGEDNQNYICDIMEGKGAFNTIGREIPQRIKDDLKL